MRWRIPAVHIISLFAIIGFSISTPVLATEEFPGRALYANVPVISTQQLFDQYDDTIIVDTRTPYEYETLRIKNAVNIPLKLNNEIFIDKIQKLRANSNKAIVFYCNGHTCMKSYKAARKAMLYSKVDNVYAYDAGVFDWAKNYPDHAELLGKSPVTADMLISRERFKQHLLPAEKFIKTAVGDVVILDIRDRRQRDGFYIFSGYEKSIPLNEKKELERFLIDVKNANKTLYIYDTVGEQVRWLQYYLESLQLKNYFFMEGGAQAFFNVPIEKLMD